MAITVMAHPARSDQAETLAAELNATITWDDGRGENDTGDRAWESLADSSDQWATVIQDDALPVDGFNTHIAEALTTIPARAAVSWYLGTTKPHHYQGRIIRALGTTASWYKSPQLIHGVAVTLPTSEIRRMLTAVQRSHKPYDFRLGEHLRRQAIPVYYPAWSLTDHDDTDSLLGHNNQGPRRAHRIGIPNQWTSDTVRL